jgi:hypothetical protein
LFTKKRTQPIAASNRTRFASTAQKAACLLYHAATGKGQSMNKKEFKNHIIRKFAEHGIDANDELITELAVAVAEDMEAQGNIDNLVEQIEQTQTPERASQAITIVQRLKQIYLRATA